MNVANCNAHIYCHIGKQEQKVINLLFSGGFANAVLVSGRWRSHISTYAKGHQLRLAHLLRELNYLLELEKTTWAVNIKAAFKQAIELKRQIPEYRKDDCRTLEIITNLDILLNEALNKNKTPKILTFQKSLRDNRDFLFSVLYNKNVPPDNNVSERCIRNFKVKLKISDQFKTCKNSFAKIRSVIDS